RNARRQAAARSRRGSGRAAAGQRKREGPSRSGGGGAGQRADSRGRRRRNQVLRERWRQQARTPRSGVAARRGAARPPARGAAAEKPKPVTPKPIQETTFRDAVASGTRATYAIQAVDKAGNVSAMSETTEETSR